MGYRLHPGAGIFCSLRCAGGGGIKTEKLEYHALWFPVWLEISILRVRVVKA